LFLTREDGTAMKYQHPELEIVRAALNGSRSAQRMKYGTLYGTPLARRFNINS
jgi:hypothetical protein